MKNFCLKFLKFFFIFININILNNILNLAQAENITIKEYELIKSLSDKISHLIELKPDKAKQYLNYIQLYQQKYINKPEISNILYKIYVNCFYVVNYKNSLEVNYFLNSQELKEILPKNYAFQYAEDININFLGYDFILSEIESLGYDLARFPNYKWALEIFHKGWEYPKIFILQREKFNQMLKADNINILEDDNGQKTYYYTPTQGINLNLLDKIKANNWDQINQDDLTLNLIISKINPNKFIFQIKKLDNTQGKTIGISYLYTENSDHKAIAYSHYAIIINNDKFLKIYTNKFPYNISKIISDYYIQNYKIKLDDTKTNDNLTWSDEEIIRMSQQAYDNLYTQNKDFKKHLDYYTNLAITNY